jgi:hypothetical protein
MAGVSQEDVVLMVTVIDMDTTMEVVDHFSVDADPIRADVDLTMVVGDDGEVDVVKYSNT